MQGKYKVSFPKVICLVGPTGSGKSKLAIDLCKIFPLEIVSVDSTLVYKNMNIGTDKPNKSILKKIPHHLVDICEPYSSYSVANFCFDAHRVIKNIFISQNRLPLLVGGSMFYFKALCDGLTPLPSSNFLVRSYIENQIKNFGLEKLYDQLKKIDPISADRISSKDTQRVIRALEVFFISGRILSDFLKKESKKKIPYNIQIFAILPKRRSILHEKIESRFHKMLDLGLEDEVKFLINQYELNRNMPSFRSIGYRQMISFILKEISYDKMIRDTIHATKNLIKNQITWIKQWKYPIYYINYEEKGIIFEKVSEFFTN